VADTLARPWTVADYDEAAQRYCASLPPEHFMEGIGQSTQRAITLASLALLEGPDLAFQVFNELLVQYFYRGQIRQVCPDNMARRCYQPLVTGSSYICEKEPVGPFLVVEYVSPNNVRKDYHDSFLKYEQELQVPYYLLFYPEKQDLRLHRLTPTGYELVVPNAHGRLALPELDLEIALLNGWARFWFRGELLPLPAEMLHQLQEAQERAEQEKQRAEQEKQRAEQEKQRAEQEKQRAEQAESELARLRQLLAQLQSGSGGQAQQPV